MKASSGHFIFITVSDLNITLLMTLSLLLMMNSCALIILCTFLHCVLFDIVVFYSEGVGKQFESGRLKDCGAKAVRCGRECLGSPSPENSLNFCLKIIHFDA